MAVRQDASSRRWLVSDVLGAGWMSPSGQLHRRQPIGARFFQICEPKFELEIARQFRLSRDQKIWKKLMATEEQNRGARRISQDEEIRPHLPRMRRWLSPDRIGFRARPKGRISLPRLRSCPRGLRRIEDSRYPSHGSASTHLFLKRYPKKSLRRGSEGGCKLTHHLERVPPKRLVHCKRLHRTGQIGRFCWRARTLRRRRLWVRWYRNSEMLRSGLCDGCAEEGPIERRP